MKKIPEGEPKGNYDAEDSYIDIDVALEFAIGTIKRLQKTHSGTGILKARGDVLRALPLLVTAQKSLYELWTPPTMSWS